MSVLKPKDFIRQVFISELEPLANKNHYISFAIMATGIEFLGKCLDLTAANWNVSGRSEANFKLAINRLQAFSKYRPHAELLYDALRNGFAHSFVPKYGITLSSKNELAHMIIQHGRLNLKCEDFYHDFKLACNEIIQMTFANPNDKMNRDLIEVPQDKFNDVSTSPTSITQSIQNNSPGKVVQQTSNTTSGRP